MAFVPPPDTWRMERSRRERFLLSLLVNLIPVIGVAFLGWSLFELLIFYWLETGVIGVFNFLKIVTAGKSRIRDRMVNGLFFTAHYGLFWICHGVVVQIFNDGQSGAWGLVGLAFFISHGMQFVRYLRSGEHIEACSEKQIYAPYLRVISMHVTILMGGWWVQEGFSTTWPMVLLAGCKLLGDGWVLWREKGERDME